MPKSIVDKFNIKETDTLYASYDGQGGVNFTLYDPEFKGAMIAYRKFSKRYKNALKKLAK